jgi:hypothetical protein
MVEGSTLPLIVSTSIGAGPAERFWASAETDEKIRNSARRANGFKVTSLRRPDDFPSEIPGFAPAASKAAVAFSVKVRARKVTAVRDSGERDAPSAHNLLNEQSRRPSKKRRTAVVKSAKA